MINIEIDNQLNTAVSMFKLLHINLIEKIQEGILEVGYDIRNQWAERARLEGEDDYYITSLDVIPEYDGVYIGPAYYKIEVEVKTKEGEVEMREYVCPWNRYYGASPKVRKAIDKEYGREYVSDIVDKKIDVIADIVFGKIIDIIKSV